MKDITIISAESDKRLNRAFVLGMDKIGQTLENMDGDRMGGKGRRQRYQKSFKGK